MILILASHAWVHFYCTQFCQDQRKREEVSHSQYKVQLVSFNIFKHGRCTLLSCNTIVFLWPHGSLRLCECRLLRSVLQYFGMGLNMSKPMMQGSSFWEMVSTRLSISPRCLPIDVVNRKKCGNCSPRYFPRWCGYSVYWSSLADPPSDRQRRPEWPRSPGNKTMDLDPKWSKYPIQIE